MCYIYALIDPVTHLVRYIGQSSDLDKRYRIHCSGKDAATGAWVRSLPHPPVLVLLETVAHKRVPFKGCTSPRRETDFISAGVVAETKWIKRFRRTVINRRLRDNSASTWDWLTNEDERKSERKANKSVLRPYSI